MDRPISHENGGSTMLVLSRKTEESVVVGGADGFHRLLKVTVLDIKGGRVRLGFEVDSEVPIHRSEVWERIHGNGNGNGNGRPASLTEGLAVPVA
jgi:carbon storage regulator